MAAATARQHKRVIVVGAGVMGSAAAHALVSSVGRAAGGGAQCTVTLLEQHEFGHKHGSSHGHSRIIRPVYSQQHYASLMPEAYARWSALDAEASDTLYTQTGGLYWGPVGFVDGSGDCDPARPAAQSPWPVPSRCALRNRAFLGTFLSGENGV